MPRFSFEHLLATHLLPRRWAFPLAGAFTLTAALACAGTVAALVVPDQGQATLSAPAQESASRLCAQRLEQLGARGRFSEEDGSVVDIEAEVSTPRAAIERSEAILRSCPGYELTRLCAGADCDPALTMSLEYAGPAAGQPSYILRAFLEEGR